MKVRDLIKLLQTDGWTLRRQKDSHRQFKHSLRESVITVAGQPGGDVPTGTLQRILREIGSKDDLMKDKAKEEEAK